jgi:hypothetical protein
MATLDSPTKASVSEEVDPSNAAARVSLRPLEHVGITPVLGGHYRLSAKSGLATVIASGGAIFTMRWADSARTAIINKIWAGFIPTTGFTAAQAVDVDVVKVTAYTAIDTGGTPIALGSSNKKRTNMNNSQMLASIATTAALGAGTGASDANAMGQNSLYQQFAVTNANAALPMQPLIDYNAGAEYPMALAQNEGFRVRIVTTMGAAGVGNFTIMVDWAEVPAF